jgi:hypothetical protein
MYEVEINGQLRTTAPENVMFKTQQEAQNYINSKQT